MAVTVNGIENASLGLVLFNPAPHTHDYTKNTITLNDVQNANPTFYAPINKGTAGQVLVQGNDFVPVWTTLNVNNSLLNEYNCFYYDDQGLHQLIINDTYFIGYLNSLLESADIPVELKKAVSELNEHKDNVGYWMPGTGTMLDLVTIIEFIMNNYDAKTAGYGKGVIKDIIYETYMQTFPLGHKGWLFLMEEENIHYYPVEFVNNINYNDSTLKSWLSIYKFNETYYNESVPKPLVSLIPK